MFFLSVVTSVSVILNGQEPAHFSDAAGNPVPRPKVPPQVASPINLLNPDRYEFYTFNDNGDLIKRLMTVKEIQSIVAGGAGEGNMMAHYPSQLESQKIENNVEDIVSNVQRVLSGEVDASAKRNASDTNHQLDTPDVSDTWSQILPAIFGNTGQAIGPQPKPPQNIAMTTDAVLLMDTSTKKTTAAQQHNGPNGIRLDELNQQKPIEASTPRSSIVQPAPATPGPAGGYRKKTTAAPSATTIDLGSVSDAYATPVATSVKPTIVPDADKLVTSFFVDTPQETATQSIVTAEEIAATGLKINATTTKVTESYVNVDVKTSSPAIIKNVLAVTPPIPIRNMIAATESPIVDTSAIASATASNPPIVVAEKKPIETTTTNTISSQADPLKKPAQINAPLIVPVSHNDLPEPVLTSTEKSKPKPAAIESAVPIEKSPTNSTSSSSTTFTSTHNNSLSEPQSSEKPVQPIAISPSTEAYHLNSFANTELMHDSIQKLSAALLAESLATTTDQSDGITTISDNLAELTTLTPFVTTNYPETIEDTTTEAVFDSDFSFNQIIESLKDTSTDPVGLLLANDANIDQFVEATTTGFAPMAEVIAQQNEAVTQNKDHLFVEEPEPQVFDIATTTESWAQDSSDATTIQANEMPGGVHSVVQEANDLIDSTTLSQFTDQDAVESSIANNEHVLVPIEHGLSMSEYVEKAATVASVIRQRPIVTADKSTRISEEKNAATSDASVESVVYETSVVRETSSVSVSGAPAKTPVSNESSNNQSDISTEISVQSDVHEELHLARPIDESELTRPTKIIDDELNIAADILSPIGFFDEEVIRHRFNEMGDQLEHREGSTESGSADVSASITTEDSGSYSQENSKSTATTSEESGSSEQASTESDETSSSASGGDNHDSVEGVQEGVAAVNDAIDSAIADANEAAIAVAIEEATRDVTTDSSSLSATTVENEFPDSRTIWPATTELFVIDAVTETNAFDDHNPSLWVSEATVSPPKMEIQIPISHKESSEETAQSSSVETSNESTNAVYSSEDGPTTSAYIDRTEHDASADSSDEESTTKVYSQQDILASIEEGLTTSTEESSAGDSISFSGTESVERDADSEDASTSSTSSDEQSTETLNTSASHDQAAAVLSTESRLGVESHDALLHELVGEVPKIDLNAAAQNAINDDSVMSDETTEGAFVTYTNLVDDVTTVLAFRQDEPLELTTVEPFTQLPVKDEQVFVNLGETTIAYQQSDATTVVPDADSTETTTDKVDIPEGTSQTTVDEDDHTNATPFADFQTESATQSPKDEQVFINLGETTTTSNTVQTTLAPRPNLPETQHTIHIKKQQQKLAEPTPPPSAAPIVAAVDAPPPKWSPVKGAAPPAHIKMPPASSAFKIKGSQASRKPAMSVTLDPAPQQALGLEESTANVSEDILEFTRLCNELAFTFWRSLTSEGISSARSLVVSPFALSSMLAMVFLGARGSTSGEMNELLRLDDMVTFNPHLIFRNITDSVENPKDAQLANSAFVRALFSDRQLGKILPFFKEKAQQYYAGHVEEVNFNLINDIVRRRTNLLVKRHTFGKLGDYLRTNNVWLNAPLAGLSANIFQTDCSKGFVNERDGEMFFQVLPAIRQRRLIPIPAVVWKSGFTAGYDPELDATAVAFGGATNVVSTVFVMPGQQGHAAAGDNLERLEETLMRDAITKNVWRRMLTTLMERPGLEVQIPRFSHRSFVNATDGLRKMGLQKLFDADNADLRGLTGSTANDLYISDMVQINTFSTCGEDKITDQHHVEMYPAPPIQHRNIHAYDTDDEPPAQETARTQSFESEYDDYWRQGGAAADEDRALDYALFDDEYLGLPLPLRPRQARIPEAPRLRFDKPFLFFVRHNPTGMILYMGRFNPRLLP